MLENGQLEKQDILEAIEDGNDVPGERASLGVLMYLRCTRDDVQFLTLPCLQFSFPNGVSMFQMNEGCGNCRATPTEVVPKGNSYRVCTVTLHRHPKVLSNSVISFHQYRSPTQSRVLIRVFSVGKTSAVPVHGQCPSAVNACAVPTDSKSVLLHGYINIRRSRWRPTWFNFFFCNREAEQLHMRCPRVLSDTPSESTLHRGWIKR